MRFINAVLAVAAVTAPLGHAQQLSGQKQGFTAIGNPLFDYLKCAAGVGVTYSAAGCTKPYIFDRCSPAQNWTQLGTYNLTDGNSGSIITRWFLKPATKELFLFFPGTDNSFSNWKTNFEAELVPYDFNGRCPDCKIHKGFLRVFQSNRNLVIYLTAEYLRKNPGNTFKIVGGSLGGAIGALYYADFTINTSLGLVPASAFSFGQPRVGNANWAALMNQLTNANQGVNSKYLRITHSHDAIPQLPDFTGYLQHGGEIWAEDRPGNPPRPDKDSTWICPQGGFGAEPASCVKSGNFLPDHVSYPGYTFNYENAVC